MRVRAYGKTWLLLKRTRPRAIDGLIYLVTPRWRDSPRVRRHMVMRGTLHRVYGLHRVPGALRFGDSCRWDATNGGCCGAKPGSQESTIRFLPLDSRRFICTWSTGIHFLGSDPSPTLTACSSSKPPTSRTANSDWTLDRMLCQAGGMLCRASPAFAQETLGSGAQRHRPPVGPWGM